MVVVPSIIQLKHESAMIIMLEECGWQGIINDLNLPCVSQLSRLTDMIF